MNKSAANFDKSWSLVQARLKLGQGATSCGFKAKDGDLSRYVARFKIARAYRASHFEGVSVSTTDAYSALLGLMLAWGAFEQFAKVSGLVKPRGGLNYGEIDRLFENYSATLASRDWDAVRPAYGFLATLQANEKLEADLERASRGEPLLPRKLVTAIRNAFAHGQLTAHFGGIRATKTAKACKALTAHLLALQAAHFIDTVQANIGFQPTAAGAIMSRRG